MCLQSLELMSAAGLRAAMQYRATALSNSSARILFQSDTVQLRHSRNRGHENCSSTENERQRETILKTVFSPKHQTSDLQCGFFESKDSTREGGRAK
ncbi:uncharacterized [Tachysurus ichikawai]